MRHKPFIDRYFRASNDLDVAAMLEHFAEDVVVKDEGKEHHGREQVRLWLEDTNVRYNPRYVLGEVSGDDHEAKASVMTSGTFPGSPLPMTFHFVFAGDKIKFLTFGG